MRNHQVDKLPATLNPRKPANQQRNIVGQLPINALSRVVPLINNDHGHLILSLIVTYEDNQLMMRGNIMTELTMQCQRCLKPMQVEIESDFECVIVATEEASKALPTDVDGYICEEKIDLHDLAEEELLLAMPMSPRHAQCEALLDNVETQPAKATHSPFADLKDLIKPN